MSDTDSEVGGATAESSAAYVGLPVALAPVLTPKGHMTGHWYRYFQSLWLKTSSGLPAAITLGSLMTQQNHTAAQLANTTVTAGGASTSAAAANAAVTAETERSIAAEDNLQTQINSLAQAVDGLTISGTTGSPPAGSPVNSLQVTHGGVNYLIPLYAA